MNRLIAIILSLFLLGWLIGMGMCHNATCPTCQTASATVVPPTPPAAVPPPVEASNLSIHIDDRDLNFEAGTTDNLLFSANTCEYATPLSEKLLQVYKDVVNHLQNNLNRILVLSGTYENTETNNCTDASDLGIARAEQVKQLLVQLGANANRIEIDASQIENLQEHKNQLVGGVNYLFKAVAVEKALRADKITLRFATNKQEINITEEQRIYFETLKAYLAQNPDAKALVTGHTDNAGNDKGNKRLSRKRSEFVRDYMIEQGIPKRQIINKGLGPDQPIATNETSEGKALNRRVEITLQ
jgi:OOP family OmpA-OmpF porin